MCWIGGSKSQKVEKVEKTDRLDGVNGLDGTIEVGESTEQHVGEPEPQDGVVVATAEKRVSYFTIEELCKSETAEKLGVSNVPSVAVKMNLQELIDNILDPLRRAYGKPIHVNSGYRCTVVNTAVGGVKNSQHLTGHAADITGGNRTENRKLWELIKALGLPIDQCIDEANMRWVHVSYDKERNRGM